MFLTGTPEGEPTSQTAADQCAASNNSTATGSHWTAYNPGTNDLGVLVSFPTEVTTDSGEVLSLDEGEAIQIDTKVPLQFGFGNVLGWTNAQAPARAIAALRELSTVTGMLVPWSVTTSELWDASGNPILGPDDTESLKVTSWQDQPIGAGNFGCISFENDSGGNIYRDRISGDPNVPPITLSEDMWVDTLPGNKIGPTDQGVLDRLEGDDWTYEAWKATYNEETGTFAETSRLILIPIIDVESGLNGQKEVEVAGFAACEVAAEGVGAGEGFRGRGFHCGHGRSPAGAAPAKRARM
jgi:hypothetical protein